VQDDGQHEKGERKRKRLLGLFREFLGRPGKKNGAERRIEQIRLLDDAFRPWLHFYLSSVCA
jgi:hypothetical protein